MCKRQCFKYLAKAWDNITSSPIGSLRERNETLFHIHSIFNFFFNRFCILACDDNNENTVLFANNANKKENQVPVCVCAWTIARIYKQLCAIIHYWI